MPIRRRLIAVPLAVLCAVLCWTADTAAARQTDEQGPLEPNRYMEYKNPKQWVVEGRFYVYPDGLVVRDFLDFSGWRYDQFRVVVPYVERASNAWSAEGESEFPAFGIALDFQNSRTLFEGREARVPGTDAPYMVYDSQQPIVISQFQVNFTNALTCVETVFDEKAAWDVPWPDAWPAEAAPWLERDPFIDTMATEDVDPVADLLAAWTQGNDPKQLPPVQLTKFLTGKVLEHIRTDITSAERARTRPPRVVVLRSGTQQADVPAGRLFTGPPIITGMTAGLNVQDASVSATSGTGSFHDYSVLLTAVLRRAGIPARTVIGVDDEERDADKRYKSWVEFALVAPDLDRVVWVPIDVWELRGSGRTSRNYEQPWKHFGTSEMLRHTVPVAFHFHPPADYMSYDRPGLYGIRAADELPAPGIQNITFDVSSRPNRGSK